MALIVVYPQSSLSFLYLLFVTMLLKQGILCILTTFVFSICEDWCKSYILRPSLHFCIIANKIKSQLAALHVTCDTSEVNSGNSNTFLTLLSFTQTHNIPSYY